MWLLLFGLTALVLMLPMLPAIVEWRRPSDIVPLHIDAQDALDPTFLARSFAARMATALATGEDRPHDLAIGPDRADGAWPLDADERRTGTSTRTWHAGAATTLPDGLRFLGNVHATGPLATSAGNVCGALWSGQTLSLHGTTSVLRWAHGTVVDVAPECRLHGRVSADRSITLRGASSFTLLHAPTIAFGQAAPRAPAIRPSELPAAALPAGVSWDGAAGRGTCDDAFVLDDGRAWQGDLVCRHDLSLGSLCFVDGNLKARGAIVAGADCHVAGALVAEGGIVLGAGCVVHGPVVSETMIVLGTGCRIGTPDRPATVAAPRIDVGPGVVVHGTLWAGQGGRLAPDVIVGADAGRAEEVVAIAERLAA